MKNQLHDDRSSYRSASGPMPGIGVLIGALAVLDATAWQLIGLFWIWHWPDHHGALFGSVIAALLIYWAVKRAGRALLGLDTYRWGFALLLCKLMAIGFLLQLMFWLQKFFA